MEKDQEKIEEIFDQLTDDNKEVINMVAKGMKIAQENAEISKHVPKID